MIEVQLEGCIYELMFGYTTLYDILLGVIALRNNNQSELITM